MCYPFFWTYGRDSFTFCGPGGLKDHEASPQGCWKTQGQLAMLVLVMNSLVVALSLPRGGVLEEEAKCFIKEVKAEPSCLLASLLPCLTLWGWEWGLCPCCKCLLCSIVFQEFQDTGIFTQLCCVLLFSNLKLLIQRKLEWGA